MKLKFLVTKIHVPIGWSAITRDFIETRVGSCWFAKTPTISVVRNSRNTSCQIVDLAVPRFSLLFFPRNNDNSPTGSHDDLLFHPLSHGRYRTISTKIHFSALLNKRCVSYKNNWFCCIVWNLLAKWRISISRDFLFRIRVEGCASCSFFFCCAAKISMLFGPRWWPVWICWVLRCQPNTDMIPEKLFKFLMIPFDIVNNNFFKHDLACLIMERIQNNNAVFESWTKILVLQYFYLRIDFNRI